MSSVSQSLCLPCSSTLSVAWRNEEGKDVPRPLLRLEPNSCHFCANIQQGFIRVNENVSQESDIGVTFNFQSFEQGGLFVRCKIGTRTVLTTYLLIHQADADTSWVWPLSKNTLSESTIEFLKLKIKACLGLHTHCNHYYTSRPNYPTRLLKLQGNNASRVSLVDGNEVNSGQYFTLSHCWGNHLPMKLTHQSYLTLREGIDIRSLPKTYQDAIKICQELNIAYLWIDSLCIYQDDLADWHAEAASMRQVYASAMCNIAASGASDSGSGLFFERDVLAYRPFEILMEERSKQSSESANGVPYLICPVDWYWTDVDRSPLNQRAWVMQERFLSKRIMHFTRAGVYWECLEDQASDIYRDSITQWIDRGSETSRAKSLLFPMPNNSESGYIDNPKVWTSDLFVTWNALLYNYTKCGMTNEDDKLVAIQGLAREFSHSTGDSLVYGMWKQLLPSQLLWNYALTDNYENTVPRKWRAPTWSWASQNRTAASEPHSICKNGRAKITIEHLDMKDLPVGQLEAAPLTLRGKLLHGHLTRRSISSAALYYSKVSLHCGEEIKEITYLILDHPQVKYPFSERVVCIGVYEDTCRPTRYKMWPWTLGVLILQECGTKPGRYRRIGVLLLDAESRKFYEAHETAEEHSITIV